MSNIHLLRKISQIGRICQNTLRCLCPLPRAETTDASDCSPSILSTGVQKPHTCSSALLPKPSRRIVLFHQRTSSRKSDVIKKIGFIYIKTGTASMASLVSNQNFKSFFSPKPHPSWCSWKTKQVLNDALKQPRAVPEQVLPEPSGTFQNIAPGS